MTSGGGDKRPPRGGRGRFVRSVDTALLDAEAARLRVQGLTFQQIADRLGYSHREVARRAVDRVLASTVRESGEELRALELARLDELWRRAWSVMTDRSDWRSVLAAVDRLLRISERRSRLLGLDAPVRHGGLSLAEIDAEIARLEGDAA